MKNIFCPALIAMLLCCCACSGFAQTHTPPLFQQVLEQIRNGKLHQALETAAALRNESPQQPFAPLLSAGSYWEMIYCQTGHINSREIWNLADSKTSPYDKEFLGAVEQALQLSQQMRLKPESAAAGALYAGLARGARARLYALRQQSMQSATESKQMRADLLEAVAKDPQLAADADVGLGAYNYYADVLSPILKVFRFFFGIPGGSREKGLDQLHTASAKSVLWGHEATYELARIYGVREGRHSRAFSLFKELSERHPENPIYALSAAYQAEGDGQNNTAIEYCQRARDAAAKMEADCRPRLLEAAQGALDRLQGNTRTSGNR